MPSSPGDRVRHGLRVAGEHRDLDAQLRAAAAIASRDSGRIASATANAARTLVAFEQVDRRPAPASAAASVNAASSAGELDAELARAGSARRRELASVDRGLAPRSRDRLEVAGARNCQPSLRGARHDRPRHRMLGILLQRGREPQRLVLGRFPPQSYADHPVLAQGERARLVEDHGVQEPRLLQPAPVAHQQPASRAQRGRDRDDERDREPQRVGAGDDEHRDQPLDGERRFRTRGQASR